MLQVIVDWILYNIIGLDQTSHIAQSLNYFIYDSIKIVLLLFLMIWVVGFIRTYLPQKRVKEWLSRKNKIKGHVLASLFGAITPFCSCSSIPMFIGFLDAGVPLGVTFSFLITSPLVNEYLVVLMFGYFGLKITALYVISGILIGIISGIVLGNMKLEKYLVKDIADRTKAEKIEKFKSIKERIKFGIGEAITIVKKLWIWVILGVGVGAFVHNFVPQETIHNLISKGGIFTVPIATIIGVPIYGSCVAIVPIAVVLFNKGVPLGTALAFMMATAALSLPEAVILRRAMKLRLIAIFFGVVIVGIILTGYVFNVLQGML